MFVLNPTDGLNSTFSSISNSLSAPILKKQQTFDYLFPLKSAHWLASKPKQDTLPKAPRSPILSHVGPCWITKRMLQLPLVFMTMGIVLDTARETRFERVLLLANPGSWGGTEYGRLFKPGLIVSQSVFTMQAEVAAYQERNEYWRKERPAMWLNM